MPTENQLNVEQTFESQKNLVNVKIIPTVMETLDPIMYPVSESIVYDMIHNRHKHQREEHLKKQKSEEHLDEQSRRKHLNSRRSNVSNDPVLLSSFCYSYYFIISYVTEPIKPLQNDRFCNIGNNKIIRITKRANIQWKTNV